MQKQKQYGQAEKLYAEAMSLQPGYLPFLHMSRLFAEQNQSSKAEKELQKAIGQFQTTGAKSGSKYTGKELAELYLESGEIQKALKCAAEEYNRRPENIDVNHVMAWAYYKGGNYELALFHIMKALVTNSKDPQLLMHAAMIHSAKGYDILAKREAAQARKINPFIEEKNI